MSSPLKFITKLIDSVRTLRNPDNGCPWHLKQTLATIAPFTKAEAYELGDAIESNNPQEIKEELADLLFHVTLYAQHAEEKGWFSFDDIAKEADEKIQRRHPWVFGDKSIEYSPEQWQAIKQQENKSKSDDKSSILSGLPKNMPALLTSHEIHKRVCAVGFKWKDISGVLDKVHEEIDELKEAIESGDRKHMEEELGDVLFTAAILGYYSDINPENALASSNSKFKKRFAYVEGRMKQHNFSLIPENFQKMSPFWQEAKDIEKAEKEKA